MSPRIALLIDAENISYKDLSRILNQVNPLGQIILKAAFGDWDQPNLQAWLEIAEQNDFKIRHQSNPSKIKNSSDMRLIMDAMDIIHWVDVDAFCLVTNDADYIPLCDKIRESKKYVIGIGYEQAAEAFIRACDQFVFIRRKKASAEPPTLPTMPVKVEAPPPAPEKPAPKQPAPVASKPLPDIRKLLSDAFSKASPDADKWVGLGALGNALRQVQPGFKPNQYGHGMLTKLLQSMPDFVELKGNAASASARLKKKIIQKPKTLKNLHTLVSEAFAKTQSNEADWVPLSTLGTAIRQVHAGFQLKTYGHATLSKLLQSMPDLVELHENGNGKSARLKQKSALKQNQPIISQAKVHTNKSQSTTVKKIPAPDSNLDTIASVTSTKKPEPVKKIRVLDPKQKRLQDLISAAFVRAPKDVAMWVSLSALHSAIHQIEPDFQPEQYAYDSLSHLLEDLPHFVQLKNNGNGKSARLIK